ncbi:hypothetical protein ISTM_13 [Insectomime virus]|uniref:Uncharacterized protein n=1 Tax=Tunisvirus fontaine2 TaxID=1421067 RepID=V9SFC7_9VIRU|nr:hypothetical protein D1R32_gp314 [Tunisvirus fontaine2]AHA45911.1 hypothetical protein ISTM_13 [Insectomime virus]AHC55031.1 hypothetical protein TNS_ORF313 [Tunisvirus fontaine2]
MNIFETMAQAIQTDIVNIKESLERLRYEKAWIQHILASANFENISK